MRVSIPDSCESAKVLRGYIVKSGYVLSDIFFDYKIELVEIPSGNVIVDSVDCELERLTLQELERQGIGSFLLKRSGGVRSDTAVKVTFGKNVAHQIEVALLNAFLKTVQPKPKPNVVIEYPKKLRWYERLFPILLFTILPINVLAQVNFPIVRQWDSVNGFAVGAGDMVSRSLRITCISGCGGAAAFNDNTAFTFGTTSIGNVGFVVDDVAPNSVAENSAGTPRMSGSRIIYIDLSKTGANTTPILVDGTGQTFPVTGPLTDAQLRASAVPISGIVDVSDSFLLDATFTSRTPAALGGAGGLKVECLSGCGGAAAFEDNDAFTGSTTPVGNIGALYDTTPPAITDGNAGIPRMGSDRILFVNASTFTNPVSGTFWQATQPVSAASLPLPTGAATSALQLPDSHNVTVDNAAGASAVNIQDGGNTITVDGTVAVTQSGTWTVQPGNTVNTSPWLIDIDQTGTNNDVDVLTLPALVAGSANIGDVDVLTFPDNEPFNQAQRGGTALIAGRCEREEPIYLSISQTANTQLITGTASERIFICSFHVVTATAQNIALVDGTGSVCATGPVGVEGFGGATAATGWNFAANGGISLPATTQSYGRTGTNADNICLFQSGAGQVSGGLTYVSIAP